MSKLLQFFLDGSPKVYVMHISYFSQAYLRYLSGIFIFMVALSHISGIFHANHKYIRAFPRHISAKTLSSKCLLTNDIIIVNGISFYILLLLFMDTEIFAAYAGLLLD